MRFGFHISIAGGFNKVVERDFKKHCDTMTVITKIRRASLTGGSDYGNMWWIDSDTIGGQFINGKI